MKLRHSTPLLGFVSPALYHRLRLRYPAELHRGVNRAHDRLCNDGRGQASPMDGSA